MPTLDLELHRPLVIFDIESTGVNWRVDRIIDLALLKIHPTGRRTQHAFRVHPGVPIPAETTRIHGISDDDVKDCPRFEEVIDKVATAFADADICGYNILRFDLPLLCEEFKRAGSRFETEGRRVVDAQRIYHIREPRDLTAALQFYAGEMHLGAHGAMDDVLATAKVLEGQLRRYADLPRSLDELDAFCNPRDPSWADQEGKLKWADGEIVINFGKNQGVQLRHLVSNDKGFLNWMLKSDFPDDTKALLRNAMSGSFPTPPGD